MNLYIYIYYSSGNSILGTRSCCVSSGHGGDLKVMRIKLKSIKTYFKPQRHKVTVYYWVTILTYVG